VLDQQAAGAPAVTRQVAKAESAERAVMATAGSGRTIRLTMVELLHQAQCFANYCSNSIESQKTR
jgi:hypothetical protein